MEIVLPSRRFSLIREWSINKSTLHAYIAGVYHVYFNSRLNIKFDTQSPYTRFAVWKFFIFLTLQFLLNFNCLFFITTKTANRMYAGFKTSPGFYDESFGPRTILFDALENTVDAITAAAPIPRACVNSNTLGIRWVITLLATSINFIHELVAALVFYNTWVCAVVRELLRLQREEGRYKLIFAGS